MTTDFSRGNRRLARAFVLAAVAFALTAFGAGAFAQTLTTGALAGHVADAAGGSLTNVLLTLEDQASGERRTIPSDRSGRFRIAALVPTEYLLTVERIGYVPLRVEAVRIEPGRELFLEISLTRTDSVMSTDRRRSGLAIGPVGATQAIPGATLGEVGGRSRTLGEVIRLTTVFTADGSAEGLPPWLSAGAVDGAWYRPTALTPSGRSVLAMPFTVIGLETARAVRNPLDVEWAGTAGALLSGGSVRGAAEPRGEVLAQWSGSAISPAGLDGGDPSFSDIRGAGLVRAAAGDALLFSAGLDGRRRELPLAAAWTGRTVPQALLDDEGAIGAYSRPALQTTTAVAAFSRFDWSLSDAQRIVFSVHGVTQPSDDVIEASGGLTDQEALDFLAVGGFSWNLGTAALNELRLAFGAAERRLVADTARLPLTFLAGPGLTFGASPEWSSARDARLHLSEALHFRTGSHAIKIGGDATFQAHLYERPSNGWSEYRFGGTDAFLGRTGYALSQEGGTTTADWTDRTFGVFAQDRFMIGDRVELMAGLRLERQTLPDAPSRDEEWQRLTGIESDRADEPGVRISPRVSMAWRVGGAHPWVISAEGGIFYDRLDPHALARWLTDDGSMTVRHLSGALPWPEPPASGGETFPRLTLLGSSFEAPRTLRLTGGLSSGLAGATVVLSGVIRRTENLPRRDNVNLAPATPTRDQHGRIIYGTLLKQDALVFAEPGSNRRFSTYDEVTAIVSDATSRYVGVSLDVERDLGAGFGGAVRYTYSRSTDDWFGARFGGWATDAPPDLRENQDWLEATSDYDAPHRVAAALIWDLAPARVAAGYRFQSGRPFTPGFQSGVDLNGDGVPGNEPSFVDESIPGTDALLARWSCLEAGAVAGRNSCRGEASHALDLTATLAFVRFGRAAVSARAEVFDLLGRAGGRVDEALYLVDAAADLDLDPVAQTVTVPLTVNDNFGRELKGSVPGRMVRLGLSIEW